MHTSKHIIDVNMVTYNFFFRVVAQKLKCFIILKIIHYKHLEEGKHTFSFLVFICCARFAISLHWGCLMNCAREMFCHVLILEDLDSKKP